MIALFGSVARPCAADSMERHSAFVPDYLKLQTGGYLGFVTAGAGYAFFRDRLNAGAYVGWVPAAIGGTEIVSFAFDASVRPLDVPLRQGVVLVPFYLGAGTLVGTGFRIFSRETPLPPGIRLLAHLGTEVEVDAPRGSFILRHGAYVQVTALDRALVIWLHNREGISGWQVWSSSIGYKLSF